MQDQSAAIAFLSDPASYGPEAGQVRRVETHGALVFLAGDEVFKIKRAVRFSYMDFSTLELRRRALEREFELNRPHAPEIYLGVGALRRGPDGRVRWDGEGEVVEWFVRMHRFAQSNLLSEVASRQLLSPEFCRDLADAVLAFHQQAPSVRGVNTPGNMTSIGADLVGAMSECAEIAGSAELEAFACGVKEQVSRAKNVLDQRSEAGLVKRCHGDLHLGNIVLWQGRPLLFDALEFNENLATTDTLYDLAFLLMDLEHCGQRAAANRVLNRYLSRSAVPLDIPGLAGLPVFLALRAGVRAMVSAQRAAQAAEPEASRGLRDAKAYLARAASYVTPPAPRLVAVGGLSGTGKSTVAAGLAPHIGAPPGALHVRTDVVRKLMFGVHETHRLSPETYTLEAAERVYAQVLEFARAALKAGHSVIVDAVFAKADEREAAARLAEDCGVAFAGIWLDAPEEVLIERVEGRIGDASDATGEVVRQQVNWELGTITWARVSAIGAPVEVIARTKAVLGSIATA